MPAVGEPQKFIARMSCPKKKSTPGSMESSIIIQTHYVQSKAGSPKNESHRADVIPRR